MDTPVSDERLIQECLQGETNCFEQLVSRYQGALIRFLRVRCLNQHEVDDIFQETFINAYRYLHTYQSRFAFSTWLFNIAVNAIRKSLKSSVETAEFSEENIEFSGSAVMSGEVNIWQIAKTNLPSEQLELLWFTYVLGYSGKDVAEILERSLPWIKINLVRSKQKLRLALEKEGIDLDAAFESG